MKYVILIGDGMADLPIEELGGRTPLEAADTPNMDRVAIGGRLGLFSTVPEGFPAGSDVANLSLLGYDPRTYYTGRAPLEAASLGVDLAPGEIAFRANLVTLAERDGEVVMADYSTGHISTEEAAEIIRTLDTELSKSGVRFHVGKSYRHLMVMPGGPKGVTTTPPHDITDKPISGHLPTGEGAEKLRALMAASRDILSSHRVNAARVASGKPTADSIWLWGGGEAPEMPTIGERFGLSGAMISAVDLLNGIGVYAGLEVINVPGATGYLDTDYRAKAEYALEALEEKDFVCVHVEAPDEAGHMGSLEDKLRAIEDFDRLVVGTVLEGLQRKGDFRLLVTTDHATPLSLRTHTSEPVPFAVCSALKDEDGPESNTEAGYNEKAAARTGVLIEDADVFINEFFN